MSSFVVQYIFVACGAYHPAPCLAAVELCFGNDILLVGSLRIAFFGYFAERLSVSVFRQFGACPVANGSEEVYTVTDELRQLRAGMFLAGQGYDERGCLPLPRTGPISGFQWWAAYSVSVVAGEDNDGILPQVILVDGIYNLADFTVYFLYEAIVCVAVHTPVFGVKVAGG